MFCDVRAHTGNRKLALFVAFCLSESCDRLEWKLGVDVERRAVREMYNAIGARLVGERGLEFIAIPGQAVLNDHLHPRLTKRAACLLVAEHILQARYLRGQIGDVPLRV